MADQIQVRLDDGSKQLAQARENSTNAVSIYSPAVNIKSAVIKTIILCEQAGAVATFRIFLDTNGTTYDQTTAMYYDVTLQANETMQIDTYWPMNDSTGNLAYRSSVANAITITVFGLEI